VEADGIVTTARRAADAAGSDQVLLVLLKADYTLERLQAWDTLGMRGTHSEGSRCGAPPRPSKSCPSPTKEITRKHGAFRPSAVGFGMGGIAAAAAGKAQAFIRHAVRGSNGQMPPGAPHFTAPVK